MTMPGRALVVLALFCSLGACAPEDASEASDAPVTATAGDEPSGRIAALLASGQPVFGIYSGEHSAEGGAAMGENRDTDFVFYSLESGPFDLETMGAYADALRGVAGEGAPPLALRIPPIKDGPDEARTRIDGALAAGVEAIVFPHVWSAADASLAVDAMGAELWPGNPVGRLVNMLIVEDAEGMAQVREIVGTEGVSVVFAGPGDLRRTYDGDMEAVEAAIQTVLAACKEFEVPCGITAGVDDIAERLEQGFRVIIVSDPEAIPVGLAAAGRSPRPQTAGGA